MSADVTILWNASAGSSNRCAELREQLEVTKGLSVYEPASPEATVETAQQLAASGTRLLVAAGGDGTINAVVNGLMEARQQGAATGFGVLPLGTANDFAATLALPNDPMEAAALLSSQPRRLDVVRTNSSQGEQYWINVATGGNAERVTELMTDDIKQTWGPLSYLRGAISVLTDLKVFDAKISFDDQTPETFTTLNILLGNGRTSGGRLAVAPEANPEDGLLECVIVLDGPAIDLVSLGTDFVLADYLRHPNVIYRRARKLRIEADPAMPFSVDGEACGQTPLEIEVLPQALPTIVGVDYQPNVKGG